MIDQNSSREDVLAAVAQNGWALQFAADELKEDKKFVLAAVAQDGRALEFAADELKKDKEVVLAAKNFSKRLDKIKEKLSIIQSKEAQLRKKNHTKAADCALELHNLIKENYEDLISGWISTSEFKKRSFKVIEKNQPELEKHRGWKQVLGNLALAIIGLGVLYAAAGLINKASTGNFLFFNKTDSANKVEQLKKSVESIHPHKK